MSEARPSEALFVRSILPFCKIIGPLWVHSIAKERQQRRDSNNGIGCKGGKVKKNMKKFRKENNCYINSSSKNKVNEEVSLCVTLLRKLYREVRPQCLGELMKSWMGYGNGVDSCVLTRGDARGRMRRVDGGRGADKVWRLDVIVAILYHGVPLSSCDSGLISHSCNKELCLRPQHLRFRVSSISVVLAMKVLSQRGYSMKYNKSDTEKPNDEFVDLCGPFSVKVLDSLKNDNIRLGVNKPLKLTTTTDDLVILNQEKQLKDHYMKQLSIFNEKDENNNDFAIEEDEEDGEEGEVDNETDNVSTEVASTSWSLKHEINEIKCLGQISASSKTKEELINISNSLKSDNKININKNRTRNNIECEERELIEILVQSKRNCTTGLESIADIDCHDNYSNNNVNINNNNTNKNNTNDSQTDWIDNYTSANTTPCRIEDDLGETEIQLDDADNGGSYRDKNNCQINISINEQDLPIIYRTPSERRRSTESKLSREEEMVDFVDMLCSMRCYYKRESSLKFTPTIFSPTSDSDELIKAAD